MSLKLTLPCLISLSLLGGLLAACKDHDHDPAPVPTPPAVKLTKVIVDDGTEILFKYSDAGQLSKINLNIVAFRDSILLTSDDQGRIRTGSISGVTTVFTYGADNILTKTENQTDGITASYTTYTAEAGKITKAATFIVADEGDVPVQQTIFEYTTDGDVSLQMTYESQQGQFFLTDSATYEYDNHGHPLALIPALGRLFFDVVSPHNITKEVHYNADKVITQSGTSTYEYGTNGLPTSQTRTETWLGQPAPTTDHLTFTY